MMKTYETGTPRAAFGLAAFAMTVITLAVAVVAPAALDSRGDDPGMLAASKVVAPAAAVIAAAAPEHKRHGLTASKPDAMEVHKDWLQGGYQG
jgi:peptidoglycan/LPS O-acetylase OafA/YrhL